MNSADRSRYPKGSSNGARGAESSSTWSISPNMSIVGLAARPGTEVLPMWSMPTRRPSAAWSSRIDSRWKSIGQAGAYSASTTECTRYLLGLRLDASFVTAAKLEEGRATGKVRSNGVHCSPDAWAGAVHIRQRRETRGRRSLRNLSTHRNVENATVSARAALDPEIVASPPSRGHDPDETRMIR